MVLMTHWQEVYKLGGMLVRWLGLTRTVAGSFQSGGRYHYSSM
jgi:hypothetical protein